MTKVNNLIWKTILLLVFIILLIFSFAVLLLKNEIEMTMGPCTTMFIYLESEDQNVKNHAALLVDLMVRGTHNWEMGEVIDQKKYNESLSDMRSFCFQRPNQSWLDFRVSYKCKLLDINCDDVK